MYNYTKKIYGYFGNSHDNWIKGRRNQGVPIQHEDSKVLDHGRSPKSLTNEVYKYDRTGKSY